MHHLDHLEILFEPSLRLNPVALVKGALRHSLLVVAWPGPSNGDRLIFGPEDHFPPNVQVTADHALGMLMRLAADGEWRNPPLGSLEYERVSREFRRLRQLLQSLVPLPGDPFKKLRGAFIPLFQVSLHPDLEAGISRQKPR
ncbi:MAG: hypothetical protein NTW21_43345 [Verrucomicrobia bacterium]|nr:hypothetical protein [Verrucomicrobiota bacterium]